MKLTNKKKFSPYQNQEWWGVVLWNMYWIYDLNLLADIQHITQVVSSIRVICFHEIHANSALRTNECYSHWSMMLGKEVSGEKYTQLQQKDIFSWY
jgi:hypothetical protein